MSAWILLFATASASDAPAPDEGMPNDAPTADAPSTVVEGRLDGTPIRFASARAYTEGGAAVTVELNTSPLGCDALGEARTAPPEERSAALTVAPVIQPDGTRAWRVVRTSLGDTRREGELGLAAVSGSSANGFTVKLASLLVEGGDHKLALDGSLKAEGCGDRPRVARGAGSGERPPQPALVEHLTLKVAGQRIPVLGARLERGEHGGRLVLSSQGLSCAASYSSEDLVYEIEVTKKMRDAPALLRGTTLPAELTDALGPEDGTITLGKASDGRVPVTASLSYDHGGYRVELGGTFSVLECP